jgi:tetratricopeptide (TPR) repeat protein
MYNPNSINPVNSSKHCLTTSQLMSYAEGKLTGKDANRIERHLLECPLCSDAVEGVEAFNNSGEFNRVITEVNQEILHQSENNFTRKPAPARSKGRVITFTRVAAAITTIAAVFFIVVLMLPGTGPAAIAAKYYDGPYPAFTTRGGNDAETNNLSAAMDFYRQGKYSEAAVLFERISSAEGQFYAGNSRMETREYSLAIIAFEKVVAINDSFSSEAKYYLGLAYLFQNEKAKGLKVMREIAADPDHEDAGKASEIIKDLD